MAEARAVADKEQAEYNSALDSAIQWQEIAERNQELLDSTNKEIQALVELNNAQCAELERLKSAQNQLPDQQSDLEATRDSEALLAKRDRLLAGLKVGKQSPEYKRTKAAIDRFISSIGSSI